MLLLLGGKLLSNQTGTTAEHPLAVHFRSTECKDEYMAQLFAPEAPVKEKVRHQKRTAIRCNLLLRSDCLVAARSSAGCIGNSWPENCPVLPHGTDCIFSVSTASRSTESSWPQTRTHCLSSTRSDEWYQPLLPRSRPTSQRTPRCLGRYRLSRV